MHISSYTVSECQAATADLVEWHAQSRTSVISSGELATDKDFCLLFILEK